MASLNFRLPAIRIDSSAQRGGPQRRPASAHSDAPRAERHRAIDAEGAALIALRRLGAAAAGASSGDAEIAGSGWFDSTWELAQGLDICEGPPADLPLDGWLQLYLAREASLSALSVAASAA